MKIAFSRVVRAAAESLRINVIPALTDDYARGQVYAVIDLLNTLELRGNWSAELPISELALQREAINRITEIRSRYGDAFEEVTFDGRDPGCISDLFADVERGNRKIVELVIWAEQARGKISESDFQIVQSTLLELMKAINEKEWRHVGPQMLALISASNQS